VTILSFRREFLFPGLFEINDDVPAETAATDFRAKTASTDELNFILGERLLRE
jgi:hypothetical protein